MSTKQLLNRNTLINVTTTTTTMTNVENDLNRFLSQFVINVYPFLLTLGFISHLINILILRVRSLRASPCTFYFLFSSIGSMIYLSGSPLSIYLSYRFGISTSGSTFGCRWTTFMIFTSALFVTLMFVSASIDRYLSSSSSAKFRRFSRVSIAKYSIGFLSIGTTFYSFPFIFISNWNYQTNRCFQLSSTLIFVYLSSRIILFYLLCPFVMGLFGFLTISNIRRRVRRIGQMIDQNSRRQRNHRRTENQLTRMLILQITFYLIFSFPSAITYTMTTFVSSTNTTTINSFRTLSLIWQHLSYISSTFLYILSANIYREEFFKLIRFQRFYHRQTNHFPPQTTT